MTSVKYEGDSDWPFYKIRYIADGEVTKETLVTHTTDRLNCYLVLLKKKFGDGKSFRQSLIADHT